MIPLLAYVLAGFVAGVWLCWVARDELSRGQAFGVTLLLVIGWPIAAYCVVGEWIENRWRELVSPRLKRWGDWWDKPLVSK